MKPYKRGGSWRVQIRFKGFPSESGTFPTKRDAELWASKRSIELSEGKTGIASHTLEEAINRFSADVLDRLKSGKDVALRLNALKSFLPIHRTLASLKPDDFAVFRDKRLRMVKNSTVLKELNFLSSMLNLAIKEWGWLRVNPITSISKPKESPHRTRVLTDNEIAAMLKELGEDGGKPVTLQKQIGIIFQFAMETGMRASEITNLEWERIHLKEQYLSLPMTKNGLPRDVPLSSRAIKLLQRMKGIADQKVFEVEAPTLDALFRRARNRCGLSGFTFHDTRHTAATRLVLEGRIKDAMSLCKMFGWENPKQAMTYFNPTATQIAKQLG